VEGGLNGKRFDSTLKASFMLLIRKKKESKSTTIREGGVFETKKATKRSVKGKKRNGYENLWKKARYLAVTLHWWGENHAIGGLPSLLKSNPKKNHHACSGAWTQKEGGEIAGKGLTKKRVSADIKGGRWT